MPVGAITMPEPEIGIEDEEVAATMLLLVASVPIRVALAEAMPDVVATLLPVCVLVASTEAWLAVEVEGSVVLVDPLVNSVELASAVELMAEAVEIPDDDEDAVRLVGCTTELGTEPVDAELDAKIALVMEAVVVSAAAVTLAAIVIAKPVSVEVGSFALVVASEAVTVDSAELVLAYVVPARLVPNRTEVVSVELKLESVPDTAEPVVLALPEVVPDKGVAVASVELALSEALPDEVPDTGVAVASVELPPKAIDVASVELPPEAIPDTASLAELALPDVAADTGVDVLIELTPEVVSDAADAVELAPEVLTSEETDVVVSAELALVVGVADETDDVESVEPAAEAAETVDVESIRLEMVVLESVAEAAATITVVFVVPTAATLLVGTRAALEVTAAAALGLSVSDSGLPTGDVELPGEPGGTFVRLSELSGNERLWIDDKSEVVLWVVVEDKIGDVKLVTVALEYDLLTSRGKYIFRLATGSALANAEAATNAATKNDLVCILLVYQGFIRIVSRQRVV
ncbi:hypothetical protein VPNG_03188 [Cytospora leucostoma]|uniref:Uncharacterized protein n=1 Tax=Cytospora leucostoma TaxID=1230097 RepID=A0A423XEP5_9PEZI|nr:hypothetical protein VPNG_03188 [Cytospora leucostoma]